MKNPGYIVLQCGNPQTHHLSFQDKVIGYTKGFPKRKIFVSLCGIFGVKAKGKQFNQRDDCKTCNKVMEQRA